MPPISYSSLFPCAIAGLLVFLGELLKPAPEDRKFAFFQDVGKMLLHIAGGTVSRSVAQKILKAVFDALELRRATLVAEKASYLVALCVMLMVVHTTEKEAASFLSLLHVLAAISLGIIQRERLRAVYDAVLIFVMLFLSDAALDAAAWAFPWVIILVKLVAVFLFVDRKFFPTPPPYMDYQDTCGNGSRGIGHATPSVEAVGAYDDGTTLFTYINHKFDYAKNLKINYTRLRDEAEKLYARRDDYKHEANKHGGKQLQLKKECKIWIEEVGRIEVEMRELKSKYKNHRSAWHLFWSHSKLSDQFVHMWAKLRTTQDDGKFRGGIMVEKLPEERAKKLRGPSSPRPRERDDDDLWIKSSTKSEDSKSRVQKARKLSGGDTSKTNESGKSVAASLTLGNESTDGKRWHADRISINLSNNELSNLPDEPPMCPNLKLLVLQRNYKLRKIPPAFFTNMPILAVLDLSYTSIMSLPKSLFELPLLTYLYLKNCEFLMVLPPEVGKLKRLDTLDMEGTEITNLPIEIKELSLLTKLRVSLYDGKSRSQSNEIIPFGVISALSNLEYIYIDVNSDDERWDDECVERILNEVCGLARLRVLGFYFPRVELLSCLKPDHASMIYQSQFRLIVGGHSKRIISRLPSNVELELNTQYGCLKYINGEGVPEVIKKVLGYAAAFHLDRHMTAKKLTEFGIENMDCLEYCVLGECNEMQVIIDGNDVYSHQIVRGSSSDEMVGFELLEFLYIYYMKNLKSIWDGPVDEWSLSHLKSLSLSTCPQLITIFTVELLENLHKLQNLTIRDCPAIKSLVSHEEGDEQSAKYYLPELRTISLHYVPNLVSISSEVCIAPKLESLSLYNCPKLKTLSVKEVSSTHLAEITGETDWWEALELTQVQHDKFDDIFISINEEGPTGNDLEMLMKNTAEPSKRSAYHRKPKTKLFLLKGCTSDIDLGVLKHLDLVSKGKYVTSYKSNPQYRGIYVKSINLEVPVRKNEFKQRMEDIGKVGQHPNIMLPFGYLFSETARYLLYDYPPWTSLYALILKEPNILGTRPHWYRILKIILGAARGISHIHSKGGIIHGNIKSSNVLVIADYDGCISDFGLAPMMNNPALTPEVLSAPELKETGEATQKSDVYNFGVMLSEIVNQYDNLRLHWLVKIEQVEIKQIIGKCKDRDPDRRPKMDEVVWLIQKIQSDSELKFLEQPKVPPPKESEEKMQLFVGKCQDINMAMNVFGTPITNSTLEGMREYLDKVLTRKDRAHVALSMKNAGQKDHNAQQYVDNLKASYGNGISTKCMIYNATGDDLTFVLSHEWDGHIGESLYPHTIQNGQWGAFMHVHTSGAPFRSSAAVVYSGLNNDGYGRDWLLSWITPWNSWFKNKAFAEVREAGHYYNDHWNNIKNLMENSEQEHTDSWGGCVSNATTGTGYDVYFVGIMTLDLEHA